MAFSHVQLLAADVSVYASSGSVIQSLGSVFRLRMATNNRLAREPRNLIPLIVFAKYAFSFPIMTRSLNHGENWHSLAADRISFQDLRLGPCLYLASPVTAIFRPSGDQIARQIA